MSAAVDKQITERPAQEQMLQIISGFWISRAVYAIAKLGIPDELKSGPKTAQELASKTKMHAPSLFRVLRALVSVGILKSAEGGQLLIKEQEVVGFDFGMCARTTETG